MLSHVQFGIGVAVLNVPQKVIESDLNITSTWEWSGLTAAFTLGAFASSLLSG